ncbi:putative amidase [Mollisia scopiformis]|uniref:Putative amidase n=1 Tax=Mollisia scopiformis TaxID=149040 RepID=A0A194X3H0_MOLSC|nr:putative amidase [Mollisia scopiformis]KUJ14716.1 putative amidase [Mollisia scopiformis]
MRLASPAPVIFQICTLAYKELSEAPTYPDLLHISVADIASGLDTKRFTSVDLTKAFIARIYEVDSALNTVVEINPDALYIAEQLDLEREKHGRRGPRPLHGVPILLKDNLATKDSMKTTAGSLCLMNSIPSHESTVVERLRKAGAVILGKTNVSEWLNFRSKKSSGGWSSRAGQTHGPYYHKQDPCGSSSGSAVAVAVGLSPLAIGTETDGSIVCPSNKNNIVGIKPTVGLVSRDFVFPGTFRQDTVGPMARTVKDAAILLGVIAGKSSLDNYTDRIPFRTTPDYTALCNPSALKGARIGIPRNAFQGPASVLDAYQSAISYFKDAGAVVVHDTDFESFHEFLKLDRNKVTYRDLRRSYESYFAQLVKDPRNPKNLEDVIKFIKETPAEEYPQRDIGVFEDALNAPKEDITEYQTILKKGLELAGKSGILGMLDQWNLDAVILPASSVVATSMAAIGGYPIVNVPMGYHPPDTPVEYNGRGDLVNNAPGIPIGLQIMGRPFDEERLISYAYAFEQISMIREKMLPKVLPKTQLSDVIKARVMNVTKSEL